MSASNWTFCPNCHKNYHDKLNKSIDEVNQKYGKIPRDEFIKLSKKSDDFIQNSIDNEPQTLREDYYIGTNINARFEIIYHCSCDACGFNQRYEYQRNWLNE